jgi:hypothetical protein
VTINALGLIVLFSLLIVIQSGCTIKLGKIEKVEKTTESEKPAPDPSTIDLSKYFPSEEKLKARLFADVNKDGNEEIIFLSGKSWDVKVQDPYLITIHILTWDGEKYASSWEQKTRGEISEELKVEDINKDGILEVISYQSLGNSLHLYIAAWNGTSYELLKPVGGNSSFKDGFGFKGAELKDEDGDGVKEIYGYYGVAGSKADVYKWDGKQYKYLKTVSFKRW